MFMLILEFILIKNQTFELESMYHLVGVVCGLAIYNDNIISMNLPLVLFKKLLKKYATMVIMSF